MNTTHMNAPGWIRPSGLPQPKRARGTPFLALALCVLPSGCAFLNGFLDPTSVGPNPVFSHEGTLDIRASLSLQDTPAGRMATSDPLPEDTVPLVRDYEYAIGDSLN